jgi:acetate---CoA ligase (ADP-forming)
VIPGPEAAAALLNPRTVAVVGDTPTSGRGGLLHEQLLRRGFTGEIIPVNPKYGKIRGLRAYPTVSRYGAPVDFVAVTLGPARALASMRDCVEAGARAVLFIGAGFAEAGADGAEIQAGLRDLAERNGIALAGPNCYGLANVRAGFAPFFGALPEPLVPGPVALISGSGALTHAIGDVLAARGTGFGYVITVGNEAGVTAADYVSLVADDPQIQVIACYLEAFRDGPAFASAARRAAAAGQRLIVLTPGRSEAGRQASAAHTAALAPEHRVTAAFLDRLGAITVDDLDELVEAVELASLVPRVGSGPVTIATISGGGCSVLADLAGDAGLALSAFSPEVAAELRGVIPGGAPIGNPVDLTGLATDDQSIISGALCAADAEPSADTGLHLFAVNTPLAATEPDRDLYRTMAATVVRTAPRLRSPVALLTLTSGALDPVILSTAHRAGVPLLQGAREALTAVARLRAATSRRPPPPGAAGGVTARAAAALTELARHCGAAISQGAAASVLAAAGVNVVRGELAAGPRASSAEIAERAGEIAASLGFPVAVKIESPDIQHKSDAGGVRLGIRSVREARGAAAEIVGRAAALGARIDGVRVEQQAPEGIAVLAGALVDPQLGPAVVIGAGGIYTELLDDAAVLIAPATAGEVREALAGLRIGTLLAGARGQPACDVDALADAVAAISEFAWAAQEEITAFDVNPLLVHRAGAGVTAVDAMLLRRVRSERGAGALEHPGAGHTKEMSP